MIRLLLVLTVFALRANAAEDAAFFETHVRPVLAEHCWSCHGPKKQTAGLRLDSRAAMLKGGENGPALDETKPEQSLLLKAIRHEGDLKMPPKVKLPGLVSDRLAEWVRRGAPWPAVKDSGGPDWRNHWAFQPVRPPIVPAISEDRWSASDIDRFVLAKLHAKGLSPSAPAHRRTLARRLSFDLTGLPPTPDEIEALLKDDSPRALETFVERLMDSPAFGEHWARLWMDVARYADTKGYVFFEEADYPWAYTFRDYVIEAFNNDLPYDRFLIEQIAADRLENADRRPLRAMGFLTVGGRFMNNAHDIIDDRIDVVTRGLMGLTVGCARCHDHKFDPIPTRDYYALYGVFASCDEPTVQPLYQSPPPTPVYEKFAIEMASREKKLRDYVQRKRDELSNGARKRAAEYLLAANALRGRPGQEDYMLLADGADINPKMVVRWQAFLDRTRKARDPVFAAWHRFADLPEAAFANRAGGVMAELPGAVAHHPMVARAFAQPPKSLAEVAKRYAEILIRVQARADVPILAGGEVAALADPDETAIRAILRDPDFPPNIVVGDYGDLDLLPDRPAQAEVQKFRKDVEQWRATGLGAPPRAMALLDSPVPTSPRVFNRGNPYNLGPSVPRQFLACLSGPSRQPFADGSGRLELARAIADAKNPLTARVFVNRVWAHLFGRGLVTTPGDFGLRGDPPSHPELLDHLAATFVADGWSVKRLVRRIVLSATYGQRCEDRPEGMKADPENSLWWKTNRHRLGFEPMRDALLTVAGRLDRIVGGPSARDFLAPAATRRTLYAHLDRLNVPGVYRTFDFPAPDSTSPKRDQTTVPPQALFMMNHPFVAECARNVLKRPDVAGEAEPGNRLAHLYAVLFGRPPTSREKALALELVADHSAANWPRLVQALLMTNEFLFVD